jgi:hypothetical protein
MSTKHPLFTEKQRVSEVPNGPFALDYDAFRLWPFYGGFHSIMAYS